MGYYTSYSLDIEGPLDAVDKAEAELASKGSEAKEAVETGGVYAKWYDAESDCAEVAKNNPDVLICLSGDGECSDDLWEMRFKGEDSERQDFCIPPFKNKNLWTKYEIDNSK